MSVLTVALTVTATEAKAFLIIGAGVDSCRTWIDDRSQRNAGSLQDEQWVLGLLSGVALADASDPLKGMDTQGVWAWIDNYCRAHPIETIAHAAESFTLAHPH
jgi:hypothetical protein